MRYALLLPCVLTAPAFADLPAVAHKPLEGFRDVRTATVAAIRKPNTTGSALRGYLGINVEREGDRIVVAVLATDSPAKNVLKPGDVLLSVNGKPLRSEDTLRDVVLSASPGDMARLKFRRGDKSESASVKLAAVSRPVTADSRQGRGYLGVRLGQNSNGLARVIQVMNGTAAKAAGIRAGDIITKVNGIELSRSRSLSNRLSGTKVGDEVKLEIKRNDTVQQVTAKLGSLSRRRTTSSRSQKRSRYRLAVIAVEYPDVKHNPEIRIDDWQQSLFSQDQYNRVNATGQIVFGSANDYYREISAGAFQLEGKVFDWIEVSKKRSEYSQGSGTSGKSVFLNEAVAKLIERDGAEALNGFDGIFFIYAGSRLRTSRGGLYWPHRGSFTNKRKRWSYFIVPEGGRRMTNISVICHEFGHMLGLPDLYARPENPGSEGVSVWCAMSNQTGFGRPQHFSAWCKQQLGWLKPTTIDPTVKQRLLLEPVAGSSTECFKVLVRPDGSEYLLLENRQKVGFDKSLPASGLLVWRVVQNRPILEESHGIQGPRGPGSRRDLVPYPSSSNTAFTPYTVPSSNSQLGGGLPVHITNIRKHDDGRISFYIGYEFQ